MSSNPRTWNDRRPDDHQYDFAGRARTRAPKGKRKVEDVEPGRSPRATNMENFKQIAEEYLPRSGTERFPRPQPISHVPEDASSNHQDLHRGNGY